MTDLLNSIIEETVNGKKDEPKDKTEAKTPAVPYDDTMNRLQLQEQLAEQAGIILHEPLFSLGTHLAPVGVKKAQLIKQKVEELPSYHVAFAKLREVERHERRRDLDPMKAGDLILSPVTGRLLRKGGEAKEGLAMTTLGFKQLLQLMPETPTGAGGYLLDIPSDRRAKEFAHIMDHIDNRGRTVVLRTRRPGGAGPVTVYAAVSEKYTSFGPSDLANVLEKAFDRRSSLQDMRVDVRYEGARTNIKAISLTNVAPQNWRVGEVFQAALSFGTSDDKSTSIWALAQLIRAICINLSTAASDARVMQVRHTGNQGLILEQILQAVDAAHAKIKPFMDLWDKNRGVVVEDVLDKAKWLAGAEEAMKKSQAMVAVPGVKPETMVDWILQAYEKEPEPTVTGLANAVSRVAQVGEFSDPYEAEELLAQQSYNILRRGL